MNYCLKMCPDLVDQYTALHSSIGQPFDVITALDSNSTAWMYLWMASVPSPSVFIPIVGIIMNDSITRAHVAAFCFDPTGFLTGWVSDSGYDYHSNWIFLGDAIRDRDELPEREARIREEFNAISIPVDEKVLSNFGQIRVKGKDVPYVENPELLFEWCTQQDAETLSL